MVPEKRTPTQMLLETTTPVFTREMGARLALARMRLNLDQKAFGESLGASQKQISRLESGQLRTLEKPFTTKALWDLLGDAFSFVMYGTGEDRFPAAHIRAEYWKKKNAFKGNRVSRYDYWNEK